MNWRSVEIVTSETPDERVRDNEENAEAQRISDKPVKKWYIQKFFLQLGILVRLRRVERK